MQLPMSCKVPQSACDGPVCHCCQCHSATVKDQEGLRCPTRLAVLNQGYQRLMKHGVVCPSVVAAGKIDSSMHWCLRLLSETSHGLHTHASNFTNTLLVLVVGNVSLTLPSMEPLRKNLSSTGWKSRAVTKSVCLHSIKNARLAGTASSR